MDVQTGLLGLTLRQGSAVSQELITSEIPLPEDRDVSEVLGVYARVYVEESECLSSAVRVGGRLEVNCICTALSGETYGFHAHAGFTHTVAYADAAPRMHASVTGQVLECSAEPDALSLKLTVVLELTAFVSDPVTTPFVTGLTGVKDVEKRSMTLETRRRVQLCDTTLRLREESDAPSVRQVLLFHGAAQVTRLHFNGASTCEAEGRLLVSVLVEQAGGEVQSMLLTLPFTCTFDTPYLPTVWAECAIDSLSVVAADASFGVIDTEAVLKLTLYGIESSTTDVLLDAYDPAGRFCCRTESVDRINCANAAQQTSAISENVLVPAEKPDAMRAVCATAMPAVTGLFERDDMLCADVMLLTCLVYRADDGRLYAFHEDIPAQISLHIPFSPDAQLHVRTLSCTLTGTGRALTVSCALEATAVLYVTEPVRLVSALDGEPEECPYSGVLIYCADAGETLWDVGKRFRVPIATLNTWNPELVEPLCEGQPVVLMR